MYIISELFVNKLNFEDRGLFCYYILRITSSDTSPSNGTLASTQQSFVGLFRHIYVYVCVRVRDMVSMESYGVQGRELKGILIT